MHDINTFIDKARQHGKSDEQVRHLLVMAGWNAELIDSALEGLAVPMAPTTTTMSQGSINNQPIAVTRAASTRGFEYSIMFISLWAAAISLGYILDTYIGNIGANDSNGNWSSPKFGYVVLVVAFPILTLFLIRTKKAEKADKSIRSDSSRKHAVQLTMLVSFLVGLGYTIFFLDSLIGSNSGAGTTKMQDFLFFVVTVVIAGGIFMYYWIDDHKDAYKPKS